MPYIFLSNNEDHLLKIIQETKDDCLTLPEGMNISPSDILFILEHLKDTTITTLNFSNHELRDRHFFEITNHFQKTRITTLNLSNNKITSDGVRHLADCLEDTLIENLDLSRNRIQGEGMKALVKHSKYTVLKKLNVSHNDLLTAGIKAFASAVCQFTELDLSHTSRYHRVEGHALVALIKNNPLLEVLKFANNYLEDGVVKALVSQRIVHPNLKELDFSKSLRSCEDPDIFSNLLQLYPSLRILKLKDDNIVIKAIAEAPSAYQLIECDLSYNLIQRQGTQLLANMIRNSPLLSVLNLRGNPLGKEGIRALMDSLTNNHLTRLDLSSTNLDDELITYMTENLKGGSLLYLGLANNRISEKGFSALTNRHQFPALQTLDLSQNQINDQGLSAILPALANTSLRRLNLAQNQFTSEGIDNFSDTLTPGTLPFGLELTVQTENNRAIQQQLKANEVLFLTIYDAFVSVFKFIGKTADHDKKYPNDRWLPYIHLQMLDNYLPEELPQRLRDKLIEKVLKKYDAEWFIGNNKTLTADEGFAQRTNGISKECFPLNNEHIALKKFSIFSGGMRSDLNLDNRSDTLSNELKHSLGQSS